MQRGAGTDVPGYARLRVSLLADRVPTVGSALSAAVCLTALLITSLWLLISAVPSQGCRRTSDEGTDRHRQRGIN